MFGTHLRRRVTGGDRGIELKSLNSGSNTSSETSLYNAKTGYTGNTGKYGNKQIPPRVGGGVAFAGENQLKIAATQLGHAAGDVENPLVKTLNTAIYGDKQKKLKDLNKDHIRGGLLDKLVKDGVISQNTAEIKHGRHLIKTTDEEHAKYYGNMKTSNPIAGSILIPGVGGTIVNEGHEGWFNKYPHIGPGNKIHSTARNELDNVAREHDIAYGEAKNKEDIHKADEKFIKDISNVECKTWSDTMMQSVAKTCIKLKTNIEQISGKVLYPQLRKYSLNILHTVSCLLRRDFAHGNE